MAVVTFDSKAFTARYPQFAACSPEQLSACFNDAAVLCDNTDASLIADTSVRQAALWALTAHMLELELPDRAGQVGRVASAGQGSVNASFDMAIALQGTEYYKQTQYGVRYLQIVSPYQKFMYVGAPEPKIAFVPEP